MIRVAYMIDHLRVGGAQRHLLEVVRRLDRTRFEPEMWSASADPGDLAPVFEREGIAVRSFGIRSTMLHPATISAVRRVARDLRGRGVSVVHGYLFEGNFLAALVGRAGHIPVTLVSKRSLDRYGRIDRRAAAWLSNSLADRVLVNASAVRKFVADHERCPEAKLVEIPNGVALPHLVPASERAAAPVAVGGPVVGMVGRLTWKKGYEFALAAAVILREQVPGVRFEIVGDGELRGAIAADVERLGLAGTVQLLGQRRDVPQLLPRFDCFALSSVIEGMPNALLEAMALGRPVVTTSAGGSAEVVEDGISGFVVPPGDAPALADAIRRVITDRDLAVRMGAAAATRVRERFSVEAMMSAIEGLYERELGARGIAVPARRRPATATATATEMDGEPAHPPLPTSPETRPGRVEPRPARGLEAGGPAAERSGR